MKTALEDPGSAQFTNWRGPTQELLGVDAGLEGVRRREREEQLRRLHRVQDLAHDQADRRGSVDERRRVTCGRK
jgi:hypothetical protein